MDCGAEACGWTWAYDHGITERKNSLLEMTLYAGEVMLKVLNQLSRRQKQIISSKTEQQPGTHSFIAVWRIDSKKIKDIIIFYFDRCVIRRSAWHRSVLDFRNLIQSHCIRTGALNVNVKVDTKSPKLNSCGFSLELIDAFVMRDIIVFPRRSKYTTSIAMILYGSANRSESCVEK